jgi:hypothetical protein
MRSLRLAAALVLTAACGDSFSPVGEEFDARLRWSSRAPSAYTYTVERGCYCLPESIGPVDVTVRAGVVESRRYTRTGADVPAQYAELFPTVDGLFARIDSARARKAASLRAEYHPELGYPTRIDIDFVEEMADDEVFWRASGLRAR